MIPLASGDPALRIFARCVMRQFLVSMLVFAMSGVAFGTLQGSDVSHFDRWAIVCSDEIAQSGVADLLTETLGQRKGIRLVERDQIVHVLEEQKLAAISSASGSSKRVSLGRLQNADALVVLRAGVDPSSLQAILCDCTQGARLSILAIDRFERDVEATVDYIASECVRVKRQYSGGIEVLIAVTPFLSKNLDRTYDDCQTQWSRLLANLLMLQPGVVVLEVEEVNHILREQALSKSKPDRHGLPVIVKGVFRMNPPDSGNPIVQIGAELLLGESKSKRIAKVIPMSQCDIWIANELTRSILDHTHPGAATLSQNEELFALGERAKRFSELGDLEISISLRQAALARGNQSPQLRAQLINDCQRLMATQFDRVWSGRNVQDQTEAFQRALGLYDEAMKQIEYLVRNRKIGREEAAELFRRQRYEGTGAYHSHTPDRPAEQRGLFARMLRIEREFLLNIVPAILRLPTGRMMPDIVSQARFPESMESKILCRALNHVRSNRGSATSLALLEKLVTDYLPSDSREVYQMVAFTRACRQIDADPEEFREFWSRLASSENRSARYYGRYALLSEEISQVQGHRIRQYSMQKEIDWETELAAAEPLRKRVIAFEKELNGLPYPEIKSHLQGMKRDLGRPRDSEPQAFPTSMGRLGFVPIDVDALRGSEGVVSCGDRIELFWNPGRLQVVDQSRVVRPLPWNRNQELIQAVAWDGKLIWIQTFDRQLIAMSLDGETRARFSEINGLPKSNLGLQCVPVAPGRALAIGSFGDPFHYRGWCAELTVPESGANAKSGIRVFHEAKRVSGEFDARSARDLDPHVAFKPYWSYRYESESGDQVALIGRKYKGGYGHPLKINLNTLDVSVLDRKLNCHRTGASYMLGGNLIQAATTTLNLYPIDSREKELCLCPRPTDARKSNIPFSSNQSLTRHGDWIYFPGNLWYRVHADTLAVEQLSPEPLKRAYWRLTVGSSKHFGLLAFPGPYRVKLDGALLK